MAKALTPTAVFDRLRSARLCANDMAAWFPGDCMACPIAMALVRAFYDTEENWRFRVLPHKIMLWRKPVVGRWKHYGDYATTPKAQKFIARTDNSPRWRMHYRRQDYAFPFVQ
jgi:hypothetical protein